MLFYFKNQGETTQNNKITTHDFILKIKARQHKTIRLRQVILFKTIRLRQVILF